MDRRTNADDTAPSPTPASRGSGVVPWLIAAAIAVLFTLGAWAIVLSFEIGEPTWVGLLATAAVITIALALLLLRIQRGKDARAVAR